jgi:hypothetical protein
VGRIVSGSAQGRDDAPLLIVASHRCFCSDKGNIAMQTPVEMAFIHIEPSEEIKALILEKAAF